MQGPIEDEGPPRTRCGYLPSESLRAFERALGEAGASSTGRALHFAADIIASGGADAFIRSIWDYAIVHIGLASPRSVVYLSARVKDLEEMLRRLPDETAYATEEFQVRVGELVLVLRDAPTRTPAVWPKVGAETHSESWVRALGGAPETAALRRVWRPEGDQPILRTIGAELCKSIVDGSTERALFWIKWLVEEESRLRKEIKGGGLTTIDRGTHGKGAAKQGVGFFILALYAELYKEFAAKQMVRMHEEFQAYLNLWRSPDKRITGAAKKQILAVMTQMLCEVPRWKVPAAPQLIRDPVAMSRAIGEVPKFFREVLAYDPPKQGVALVKAFRGRGKDPKAPKTKKGEAAQSQMDAFEAAMDAYFSRV